jgi:hypothetical protein
MQTKQKRLRPLVLVRVLMLSIFASLLHNPLAWSAIHKCTQADGKIILSDLPCQANQTASPIKATPAPRVAPEASSEKPAKKQSTYVDKAEALAIQRRMEEALSPECVRMTNAVFKYFFENTDYLVDLFIPNPNPEQASPEIIALVNTWEKQCSENFRKFNAGEIARHKNKH